MKTVIEMAREAGIDEWWDSGSEWRETFDSHINRFAELVRADEREKYEAIITSMTKLLEAQQKREGVAVDMIAAGIAAEREACANVCENEWSNVAERMYGEECAAAIRARSQK